MEATRILPFIGGLSGQAGDTRIQVEAITNNCSGQADARYSHLYLLGLDCQIQALTDEFVNSSEQYGVQSILPIDTVNRKKVQSPIDNCTS